MILAQGAAAGRNSIGAGESAKAAAHMASSSVPRTPTRQGFRNVVADLDVGAPELLAVLAVESKTCGFLPDRRPIIDDSRY